MTTRRFSEIRSGFFLKRAANIVRLYRFANLSLGLLVLTAEPQRWEEGSQYLIRHLSSVICHPSSVIRHLSSVIRHH